MRCAILLAALAVSLPCQERTADTIVVDLESALTAGDEETAADLLLEAEAVGKNLTGSPRSRLQARLKPARARLSANLNLAQTARRDAARALAKVADAYVGRSWHHTASEYLDQARRLDPTVHARRTPQPPARCIGVGNQLARMFAPDLVKRPYEGPDWRVGAEVSSPKLTGRDSTGVFASQVLQGSYEAAITVAWPQTACKMALAFARPPRQDAYYLLELVLGPRRSDLRLLAVDGEAVKPLGATTLPTRALRLLGGELAVAVSPSGVRGTAGGVSLEVDAKSLPYPTTGALGLFVSGDTPYTGPIVVESLRVEQR